MSCEHGMSWPCNECEIVKLSADLTSARAGLVDLAGWLAPAKAEQLRADLAAALSADPPVSKPVVVPVWCTDCGVALNAGTARRSRGWKVSDEFDDGMSCTHGVASCDPCLETRSAKWRQLRADLAAATARVAKLEARLEIDHKFVNGQRVEIPSEERDGFPDGIFCRDATIAAQREQLDEQRSDLAFARLDAVDAGVQLAAANATIDQLNKTFGTGGVYLSQTTHKIELEKLRRQHAAELKETEDGLERTVLARSYSAWRDRASPLRERCARVAEDSDDGTAESIRTSDRIAAAIRELPLLEKLDGLPASGEQEREQSGGESKSPHLGKLGVGNEQIDQTANDADEQRQQGNDLHASKHTPKAGPR